MKKNPFKFGSIVESPYFTNRIDELIKVKSVLRSENHLIVISPRRYGKTSLINKAANESNRPFILIDLQVITTIEDLAAQLLKRLYRVYPFQKIKVLIKHFRIIPSLSVNPLTNEVDVTFRSEMNSTVPLEDVIILMDKVSSSKKKLIVIFDEFQDIQRIGKDIDRHLRSYMQKNKYINYVFLGSQESLIRQIFERKKSPFYHFGYLLTLGKISHAEFMSFLKERFMNITSDYEEISNSILRITHSHPYYTQQLAYSVWEIILRDKNIESPVESASAEIVNHHDVDYERLWNTLNRTDMRILIGMNVTKTSPLSKEFARKFDSGASSTTFSSLKRLIQKGLVVKSSNGYEIDDPFFARWLQIKRNF